MVMKRIIYGLLALVCFALVSCLDDDDDNYSLGNYWVGFGIFIEDSGSYKIILDDGEVLQPVSWSYNWEGDSDLENGARVLVNFTILDELLNDEQEVELYYVRVNDIQDILMKGILNINEENADSIGNDPIIVKDYWMTDSLLNFKLKYWGYNEIHFLNLIQDSTDLWTDDGLLKLQLRHNANNDDAAVPYTAYVSFSLNALRVAEQDSIEIQVSSVDYDEVSHTFNAVFNYSELE